jgi:hypothetical protein
MYAVEHANPQLNNRRRSQDLTLAHAQTMFAVDNLNPEAQLAHMKHADPSPDAALAQAKTLYAIDHMENPQLKHVPSAEVPDTDKFLAEALTMSALNSESAKSHLKEVAQPSEGLTTEQLTSLMANAEQEKAAGGI